jgi:hypothetical protein
MQEQEYQSIFNKTLAKIMTLIEVSGNEPLKREIKSAMFDFSDNIRERLIQGERDGENFNR